MDSTAQKTSLHTLVHLGAGQCGELNGYLQQGAKRIVLVEAEPEQAQALQEQTESLAQIQVIHAAVAGKAASATFHCYSLPETSSLRRATGLKELYPGLKTTATIPVQTITPDQLIVPLALDSTLPHCLVIDTPGEEQAVLEAIASAEQLQLFSQIHLYCGRESLYEGSSTAHAVVQWLSGQGFDLQGEDDSQDPDRPRYHLKRNAFFLQNRALQEQINILTASKARTEQSLNQARQAVDEKENQLKEQANRLKQLEEHTAQQARQLSERDQQLQELEQALAVQVHTLKERETQLKQLEEHVAQHASELTDRDEQLKSLQQQLAEQGRVNAECDAQLVQFGHHRDEQARLLNERQQEIIKLSLAKEDLLQQLDERSKLLQKAQQQTSSADAQRQQAEQALADKSHQLTEMHEQLVALQQDHEKLITQQQERDTQWQAMEQQLAEHKAQHDKTAKAHQEQQRLAIERQTRIRHLEHQLAEMVQKQAVLEDEMVRAEGQIDLIKDLLLREPGL